MNTAAQNKTNKQKQTKHGRSHTCQPIQFTSIKYSFFINLGGYGHTGKQIQENIIFMDFVVLNQAKRLKNC